jgi:hypothetical protein
VESLKHAKTFEYVLFTKQKNKKQLRIKLNDVMYGVPAWPFVVFAISPYILFSYQSCQLFVSLTDVHDPDLSVTLLLSVLTRHSVAHLSEPKLQPSLIPYLAGPEVSKQIFYFKS